MEPIRKWSALMESAAKCSSLAGLSNAWKSIIPDSSGFRQLSMPNARPPAQSKAYSADEVALAVRRGRPSVPFNRDMHMWEIEALADRLAEKLRPPSRRDRRQYVEIEGELTDRVVSDCEEKSPSTLSLPREPREDLPSVTRLRALKLMEDFINAKYRSRKITVIIEQMVLRAECDRLAETFPAEKERLREWHKEQVALVEPRQRCGRRKNEGQLPAVSTFDKNINSLEPIYHVLRAEQRSKFTANSEVHETE
jgi:hypothetical protein